MTDLNDWRLIYPGTELVFGTYASRFPFTKQVEVGTPDTETTDGSHPNGDGRVFGVDTTGGLTLTFEVAVPEVPARTLPGAKPWHTALDAQGVFTHAWRAKTIRKTPGAVCELVNADRSRMVYGRPRNLKPSLVKARQGWIDLVCDFATVDDVFYGATERSVTLGVQPAAAGAFYTPLVFPWVTAVSTAVQQVVNNEGTDDTWPVLNFRGPSSYAQVEVLDGNGGVAWLIRIAGALAYDEICTVDTRPWTRRATINGKPAGGRLRGTNLNECSIPPGVSEVRYTATDPSGGSAVTLNYRDAFSSL